MAALTPDYSEVVIGGYHFPLFKDSDVQASAVDRFPGKITVGDYTLDSNDLLSTINISDLSGGHGIVDHVEGTTDNRYRIGTMYTRYPRQWTKPFKIDSLAHTGSVLGNLTPIGDMYDYANSRYDLYSVDVGAGQDLHKNGTDTTYDLTSAPTWKAVAYRGAGADTFLFIPYGTGYATFEPDGPTFTNNTSPDFVAFCAWDDKLIGIDIDGQLHYATSAAATTTWTSYGTGGKLDRSIVPKSLVLFKNQAGENTVYVVSDSGVFAFDPATPRLYEIPDLFSIHPSFGIAATKWRGNLYVAAGMDILEFNGSVIRNIGLSRDDGLPYSDQGKVIDLVGSQNSLYAYVSSVSGFGVDTFYSVHEWSGFGWHQIFHGAVSIGAPTWMHVSRNLGTHRLYWGVSNVLFYQNLPVTFTNPQEAIAATGIEFGYFVGGTWGVSTYRMDSGRFDGGMPGYKKIANAIDINVTRKVATDTITVYYRIDDATSWTALGTVSATGHTILQFGTPDADGIYPGLPFYDIEFREEYVETASTVDTDVTKSMVFSFLKLMNPSWAWTLQLDLTKTHNDHSPEQLFDKLVALKDSGTFYSMKHLDDTYRIRIAGMSGAQKTGKDKRGVWTISGLEIPQKLGAPV